MIEKFQQQPINIEKSHLNIDKENLDGQLEKASEILLKISQNNNFSTFSHFGKLVELVNESGGNSSNALELLKKWDYSSLEFIQKEKCGNCVDFATLGQKMLLDAGVPTTIVGTIPDTDEFSKTQINFMGYRHTSLLYANESKDLELFMFEPGWKFPKPIVISPGIISGNNDWQFEIINMGNTEFVQKTFNMHKKKSNLRIFSTHPLSVDSCITLTKKLIQIPRKLELVNKLEDDVPTYYIKFDPTKQIFTTNAGEVTTGFLPNELDIEQIEAVEKDFNQRGLIAYLSNIFTLHKSLPDDFWIKDLKI